MLTALLPGGGQCWLVMPMSFHLAEGAKLCLQGGRVITPPVLSIAALFLHDRVLGLSVQKLKWNLILSSPLHSKTWCEIPAYV